jgi:hypothetical protein
MTTTNQTQTQTPAAGPKHHPYNQQALFAAKTANVFYSFGFGTGDPEDLNMVVPDLHLFNGYAMNLVALREAPRTISAMLNATPQVETLYHASKLVDDLWIHWDSEDDELVGTWRPHPR